MDVLRCNHAHSGPTLLKPLNMRALLLPLKIKWR